MDHPCHLCRGSRGSQPSAARQEQPAVCRCAAALAARLPAPHGAEQSSHWQACCCSWNLRLTCCCAAADSEDLSESYSMLPTAMAEAVLASRHSAELSRAAEAELQQFIAGLPARLSEEAARPAPAAEPAVAPEMLPSTDAESASSARRPASGSRHGQQHAACSSVVTGAMMTALERAQRWSEVRAPRHACLHKMLQLQTHMPHCLPLPPPQPLSCAARAGSCTRRSACSQCLSPDRAACAGPAPVQQRPAAGPAAQPGHVKCGAAVPGQDRQVWGAPSSCPSRFSHAAHAQTFCLHVGQPTPMLVLKTCSWSVRADAPPHLAGGRAAVQPGGRARRRHPQRHGPGSRPGVASIRGGAAPAARRGGRLCRPQQQLLRPHRGLLVRQQPAAPVCPRLCWPMHALLARHGGAGVPAACPWPAADQCSCAAVSPASGRPPCTLCTGWASAS